VQSSAQRHGEILLTDACNTSDKSHKSLIDQALELLSSAISMPQSDGKNPLTSPEQMLNYPPSAEYSFSLLCEESA
jgi:hypothetical protein